MNLIQRYIFGKALSATLIILGSLAGVVWIVQALKGVDIITSKGQTILAYLSLTTLAVPNILLAIIPVALLLSTIHTINGMNTNTELVVVTASGSSNWSIAKPLLVLALLCSLFAGLVGHIVSPLSLYKLKTFLTEMRADLVTIIINEGTFNEVEDGLTFHIAKRDAGGVLSGILISDDRDENTSIIYSANEGIVTRNEQGSYLRLNDGEIQQTNRKDGSVTAIKYKSYVFDLSSLTPQTSGDRKRRAKERNTLELLNPDFNDKEYLRNPGRFRAQIHERFSEMLWPFAYVFMILAFAGQARSNRQSFGASITAAAISVVVARGTGFSAVTALKTDPGAVFFVYALPLSCILFGSYFVFTNRQAAAPQFIAARVDIWNGKLLNFIEKMSYRYKAFRRKRAGIKT